MSYTELQVTTNFSFLRGASHPEEMVEQAFLLGYKSIAVTDVNTSVFCPLQETNLLILMWILSMSGEKK